MSGEDFARALRLVLVDEGGLDDDPHDHGGRTAHGIIQREYDGYRTRKGLPHQDVWRITPTEYTEIYHDRYWEPLCDQLPPGVDYVFFDVSVNAGPLQAARQLQAALGNVNVDGHVGAATLGAVANMDVTELIHAFCERRRMFYRHLAQFPRYGRGWLARVNHVERAAKEMAAGAQPIRYGLSDDIRSLASARANGDDVVQPTVSVEAAASSAAGTTVAASAFDQVQQVAAQLAPLQDTIQVIKYALIVISVISAGLAIYAIWHKSNVKEAIA